MCVRVCTRENKHLGERSPAVENWRLMVPERTTAAGLELIQIKLENIDISDKFNVLL